MSASCPNCGANVEDPPRQGAVLACAFCRTTLLIHADKLEAAGTAGELFEGPQLFEVGQTIKLGGLTISLMGRAQFSYGKGYWDEYWAEIYGSSGQPCFLSVDEGDLALQRRIPRDESLPMAEVGRGGRSKLIEPNLKKLKIGHPLVFNQQTYYLQEFERAQCIALEGAWPEDLAIGEVYTYLNAADGQGGILSAEIWGNPGREELAWFIGEWHSPFDIEISGKRGRS